jgi:hypothetical protein
MAKSNFLDKNNIKTLWDVISDEEIFKTHRTDIKNSILQIFSENIKGFYNSESKNSKITLMEMNKKYILMILNFIKTTFPKPSRIVIHEEKEKELITIEERQQDRTSQFNKSLNIMEEEFKNAMALPVPEIPNFSDNVKESPITEMERAIKEMAEQRNYDMEQINKNYNNNVIDSNWLQPTETSTKPTNFTKENNSANVNSRLKHIKLENMNNFDENKNVNQVIDLNKRQTITKKHIQWFDQEKPKENIEIILEENNNDEQDQDQDIKDIFSKLKPIQHVSERNRITTLEETVQNMKTKMEEMNTNIETINTNMNEILKLLQEKNNNNT